MKSVGGLGILVAARALIVFVFAFHGAGPDVAAREDARDARLEEVRVAIALPESRGAYIRAGEHIAVALERDLRRQPSCLGVRSDEDEQPTRLESRRLRGRAVAD